MKSCVFHFISGDENLIRGVAQRASRVDGSGEGWWQAQVRHPSPNDPRWSIEIEANDEDVLDMCLEELVGFAESVQADLYPQTGD